MKYTYRYIKENRYDVNASKVRKFGDRFVLMTVISKALSPIPVYIFLNLGFHPDTITLVSFASIVASAYSFIIGFPIIGVLFMLCFALLDSVDGDMARCVGPSSYGGVLDSFGADLFYACIPASIGYYLFSHGIMAPGLSPDYILLLSIGVSVSFILYRLINTKVLHFRRGFADRNKDHSHVAKEALRSGGLVRLLELYRHILVRGNFFSEPGLIFWFTVLVVSMSYGILGWYIVAIFLYNLGYLLTNFIGTYLFFREFERKKATPR